MSAYNDDPNAPADDYDDVGGDGFDDPASDSLDEVALDDESLDEWSDQPEDGNGQEAKPKKKSSALIFIIAGVAILAGGGFAFMKFSGNKSADLTMDVPAPDGQASELAELREEAPADPPVAEATPPAEEATKPESQGFMAEAPAPAATPDTPAPSLPDSPAMTAVEAPAATPPSPELPPAATPETDGAPVIGSLQPVSDFPSVDLIKKADPTPAQPAVEEPPVSASDNEPATLPVPDAPPVVAAATSSTDADAASEKIKALEADLSAAKKKATADAVKVSASEDKISALETKVAELEKKLAAGNSTSKADLIPPASRSAPESKPELVRPRVTSSPAVARSPKPVSVSWDLRSAQPGQAMLAKRGGGDIRTVGVGDSLPGLGKILSIEQSPRGWVVKGTQGRVTQ